MGVAHRIGEVQRAALAARTGGPRPARKHFPALRRVKIGVFALLGLTLAGTLGYMALGWYYGHDDWTFLRCLYMMVITITTIGYGDILAADRHTLSLVYTIMVSLVGMGASLYVISMATAFLVEGDLKNILWSRKMSKRISKLEDHFIVCGVGDTGVHAIQELVSTKRAFVAIDRDEEHIRRVQAQLGSEFPAVLGDATDDDTLLQAGVRRAAGLVAVLSEDRDNLFLTLTARQLNSRMRIVSKGIQLKTLGKLRQAGADSVVSPNVIGGMRMVSEMVRPATVTFLDTMLRDRGHNYRFEDLRVEPGSSAEGRTLDALDLNDRFHILAVALRGPTASTYDYCPRAEQALEAGTTLVVLGEPQDVQAARGEFSVPEA